VPNIRIMQLGDIPASLALCRQAGWNQVEADWRRLLRLEPEGLFVAEIDGRVCGTISVTAYAATSAWIGMLLVDPDFRRRGIGSALMARCIRTLQDRGVESIKLDATDAGRPVYLKLGFRDERPIHRYSALRPTDSLAGASLRPVAETDWAGIAEIDGGAFGADRLRLLRLLATDGPSAIVEEGGRLRGYGFARGGHEAGFLGPIVATDAASAEQLTVALLAALPAENVYWDILPDNAAAADLAEQFGFSVARRLTRMVLGETMNSGDVCRVYGAAGFELG
jgi:predicted N-acetyltransferase YhbS